MTTMGRDFETVVDRLIAIVPPERPRERLAFRRLLQEYDDGVRPEGELWAELGLAVGKLAVLVDTVTMGAPPWASALEDELVRGRQHGGVARPG